MNLSPDLSPEMLQSILPASAEDSACLPFGHLSTQFCTSVKILGGLEPDTEWELLPKHFSIRREKSEFPPKRETRTSEMKSVHRGRLNALGDGITA